jgi:hypothetical protein
MMMNSHSTRIGGLGGHGVLPREAAPQQLAYVLSWTAYLSQTWRLALRVVLLLTVYTMAIWILRVKSASVLANAGVFGMLAVAVAWTLYDIAYLRTIKLIVDRQGIWLHAGLFAWSKGMTGLRWDEVGVATYRQSFASWACNSYGVSVSHRFTTNEEIYLAHVKDGAAAVQSINRLLVARASAS